MRYLKKHLSGIAATLLFLLGFLSVLPNQNTIDIWLELISGKVISQFGIIHTDVLSYTGFGRTWFPYQWLFQLLTYEYVQIFGIAAIHVYVGFFAGLSVLGIYLILRKFFSTPTLQAFLLSLFFLIGIYDFLVPRAQLAGILLLIYTIYGILLYRKTLRVRYLLFTLLLVWLWANMHSSEVIGVYLLFAYTIVCGIETVHKKTDRKQFFTLLAGSCCASIISILPPLFFTQYQALLLFYKNLSLVQTIQEWKPLYQNSQFFWGYSICFLTTILGYGIIIGKKRSISPDFLPLLIFLIMPFFAIRNEYYGIIALVLLAGLILQSVKAKTPLIICAVVISLATIFYGVEVYSLILRDQAVQYPTGALSFLEKQQLKGNMFNSDEYADYLLYYLYPRYKVFIDGRFDVYLCCEMPIMSSLESLSTFSSQANDDMHVFDTVLNRYSISYVLITRDSAFQILLAQLLSMNPNWSLVFWDDNAQIFVRHDGKNNTILQQFGTKYATPYATSSYQKDHPQEALYEYQRMVHISDSAKSENTIGIIDLQLKNVLEAKRAFEKAIQSNPTFIPPYINLAEILTAQQDFVGAENLYTKVISLDSTNVAAYIQLGQLYAQTNNIQQAKQIWQAGLSESTDSRSTQIIQQLLNTQ